MTLRLKICASNGAICGTGMCSPKIPKSMPLCGVAYVKSLSTRSLAAMPLSGHIFWIMLRQIRPPIECATSHTFLSASSAGFPSGSVKSVLARTSRTKARSFLAAVGRS